MRIALAFAMSLCLAACTGSYSAPETSVDPAEPIKRPLGMTCDASFAQHHVGEKVTQELGLVIREETGAKSLRWGPPNSAWTMDYSETRVNVRYDETMTITAITCG
ncbi:I78 family peptidase inhibitor [Erythrobacter sp. F6033]|uniref:I78 family peptidase inhibitor n=1 Tax=Erythrobacter sp. F6033 TaxID=2926401 RepID=UPI001FF206BC|nr:I78 family peptidase inhibitor [Erythrobacter sp. F6033]MCK0127399.1 I78 family peptidase inhibitor [Erythrobacter sp. F6033]